MKLKKGDEVVVISGVDKGKKAKIFAVLTHENKVVLEGEGIRVNKKHTKPSQDNPNGGVVDKAYKIDASNVMIVAGKNKVKTKVGHKVITDKPTKKGQAGQERKVRYSKKTGDVLD